MKLYKLLFHQILAKFSRFRLLTNQILQFTLGQWKSQREIWKLSWYFEEFEVLIPPCPAIKNLFSKHILELNQPMGNIEEFLQLAFNKFQPKKYWPIRIRQKIIDQSEFRNFPYINLRQRSVFHTFLLKLHFCLRRFSNWFPSSNWFSRLTNHDQLKTLLSSRWSDIPPRKFVPCPSKGLITKVNCSFKRFSNALLWLDERFIQSALVVYKRTTIPHILLIWNWHRNSEYSELSQGWVRLCDAYFIAL